MKNLSRREFLSAGVATLASLSIGWAAELPTGSAPQALNIDWFPSRLHAFVWRNWALVDIKRMAEVVGAHARDLEKLGRSMGLEHPHGLSKADRRRASLTIIRRNWHLLPYEQLLQLLGWSAEELAYTLREDDFFYIKLGSLKPKAAKLEWKEPTKSESTRAEEIRLLVKANFPSGALEGRDPLFSFVKRLSKTTSLKPNNAGGLRLGYSYFALYGDPLIDASLDPYPDGYLARLAAAGVNAVWLQGVLGRLSPLPWAPETKIEDRRSGLRKLVERAGAHGIKVFLYLNEPRALPVNSEQFKAHPDWRGVAEGEFAAVCTSPKEVRDALRNAVEELCRAVPDLGGFFTISASENLTSCWSHHHGEQCPRCKGRAAEEVIAEVNATFREGIAAANGRQRLLVWDWGWQDQWAERAIELLPKGVELMSVSEWSLPIERGGVKVTVGEYSLSAIGPGPRAKKHWATAQKRGLPIVAKIQTGNTWELSAVPYIPVLENIARHIGGLRELGVKDLMLGWTLGGRPSPNMEAVAEIMAGGSLENLARRRGASVEFWKMCSAAFREFPYDGGVVYNAPLQMGPANPLWAGPTKYGAAMVGIPYDDLDGWRGPYPPEIFATQLEKVARGFEAALAIGQGEAEERRYAEAAAIHFASVANQSRFVMARRAQDARTMKDCVWKEAALAKHLHALQSQDSQIGFEASNQYYYTPHDLVEKVINCDWVARNL